MNEITIYLKHRRIKQSLGIFEHWFIDIPSKDIEIHPGLYNLGTHLKHGTTKNALNYLEYTICENCFKCLVKSTFNLADVFYYPIINCESLTSYYCDTFPISAQLLFALAIVTALFLVFLNKLFIFVAILLFIGYLLYQNYISSRTYKKECNHLASTTSSTGTATTNNRTANTT
jgi:hypothetical protein